VCHMWVLALQSMKRTHCQVIGIDLYATADGVQSTATSPLDVLIAAASELCLPIHLAYSARGRRYPNGKLLFGASAAAGRVGDSLRNGG